MKSLTLVLLLIFTTLFATAQRTVEYHLVIRDTVVTYEGKTARAIAVNGQIPMPTLHFTEGDTAVIFVHNQMHHETSIHWHGLLLPNEQDGVPYLTTAPIKPHMTHKFEFPLRQNGTYWYHSHTMLQEQVGMYGALIIHERNTPAQNEEVVLLSDWTKENPHQVERSLHYATDWYMIKKNAVQSYWEAIQAGKPGVKLENEWKRMHAMDVSDVYYDQFLVNGDIAQSRPRYKQGDKIRLRVINGSSSTYFWLNYAGGKMTVVASDGAAVEPVSIDRLIIGVSETYDVEVEVPENGKSFEFTATAEDRTGFISFWLGEGEKVSLPRMPPLDYFAGMKMMNDMMTTGGRMDDMGMDMSLQQMDMNMVMYREPMHHMNTLNYAMLRSPVNTKLPDAPMRTLHFMLTGNMNRYVWTVNNRTISESDKILIKARENIRIIMTNHSMMRHPMHLHGHYFRVVNGQGDYAPLKNVLDIMPMETDTIEFHASEGYGDWFFHCHILYHMMAGMGRIFSYENSPPNPQIPDPDYALRKVYADDRRFFLGAELGLESNGSDGEVNLMNTRWRFNAEWRLGLDAESGYETESHFGRYFGRNQYLWVYGGWDWRYRKGHAEEENVFGQTSTKNDRSVFHAGFQYILPWLIQADVSMDHTGYLRLQFSRDDLALTRRLRGWATWNTDLEYSFGAKYILTKYLAASTHYDSDMGWGLGMTIMY